jgi:hypothetical protein
MTSEEKAMEQIVSVALLMTVLVVLGIAAVRWGVDSADRRTGSDWKTTSFPADPQARIH